MTVFLREATNAHNLRDLLPLVTAANQHRFCLCTDDRQPSDLLDQGHMDHLVRMAIAGGLDPVTALRLATWNTAHYFRLHDRGAVTPGRRADLIVFRDLAAPRPHLVFRRGAVVADGEMLPSGARAEPAPARHDERRVGTRRPRVPAEGERVRVIGVIPDQLVTEHLGGAARRRRPRGRRSPPRPAQDGGDRAPPRLGRGRRGFRRRHRPHARGAARLPSRTTITTWW